jgi:hypothetical protein
VQVQSSMVLIFDAPSELETSLSFNPMEKSSIHSPSMAPEMLAPEVTSGLRQR